MSEAIDLTLYNRKAGIEYIEYNNYKLQNFHDNNKINLETNLDLKILQS